MRRFPQLAAQWLAVTAVGLASFVVVRLAMPITSADAETPPGRTYTLAEVRKLLAEDAAKPRFHGVLNGITLGDRTTMDDVGCTSGVQQVDPARTVGTDFAISMGYLPEGFRLQTDVAAACGDGLLYHSQIFSGPKGELEVGRLVMTAVDFTAPAERIKNISVRGRPAVLIMAVPGPGMLRDMPMDQWPAWRIFIREKLGITEIVSRGITLEEGLKVADQMGGSTSE